MPAARRGGRLPKPTPHSAHQAAGSDPLRSLPPALLAGLAHLQSLDADALRALSAPELGELLIAVQRFTEQLNAFQALAVDVFDRTGGPQVLASVSVKSFLSLHALADRGTVARQVSAHLNLAALPQVRDAQAQGVVSAAQAKVIADAVATLADDQVREEGAATLLDLAKTSDSLKDLKTAAAHLRALTREDGDEPAPVRNTASLARTGTSDQQFWHLTATLDAATGEMLRNTLELLQGEPDREDPRTSGERLGEALAQLAVMASHGTLGVTGNGNRPALTLLAPLDILRTLHLPQQCPDSTVQEALPPHDTRPDPEPDPTAEPGNYLTATAARTHAGLLGAPPEAVTARGLRLTPATARELTCDCTLRVLLTDGQGMTASIGRRTRKIPAHIRDTVTARDHHCVWPGCQRPPEWNVLHHMTHWADGGPTSTDNLALICPQHHRELHTTGWELTLHHGHPTLTPPPHTTLPHNTRYAHAA
jgi:hypothetical protein